MADVLEEIVDEEKQVIMHRLLTLSYTDCVCDCCSFKYRHRLLTIDLSINCPLRTRVSHLI